MICPICFKEFSETDIGLAMPFCSIRCKMIDANRWLNEEYSLPFESEDIPEEIPEKQNIP